MPIRSWKALVGFGVLGCLICAAASHADDKIKPVVNHVNLELKMDGMGDEGCEVVIKPGHPSSKFRQVQVKFGPGTAKEKYESYKVPFTIVAQSTSADRDCSFEVIIKEPGKPDRSYQRGLRLAVREEGKPIPVKSPTFYLTAPSLASKAKGETKKR